MKTKVLKSSAFDSLKIPENWYLDQGTSYFASMPLSTLLGFCDIFIITTNLWEEYTKHGDRWWRSLP